MGLINYTPIVDGTTAQASQVNTPFNTVFNEINGNLSAANLANNAVTTAKIADGAVTASKLASGLVDSGWVATLGTHSVSTGYNSGNRSFLINTSTDLSGIVSEGMRYRVTRGTTPPTQCADLEASSSHYASKSSPTGITFTDDFTCEAWIKLESYGAISNIVSRYSSNGWILRILADGRAEIAGQGTTIDLATSYQSVPLNKWVHIAASLDMSGSSGVIYIDGVSVPVAYTNGAATSITQAGNLQVGATAGASFFDGKLADVRVWSDIRTATEIRDNMYNYPSDTTGLVAHFKLNGDFTDASSNGNDLTAQNGAAATNADNPWNATEYGVITAVTSSTIQVFCPEGYGIPNETLTSPFYSTQDTPYGFPRDKGKWELQTLLLAQRSVSSPAGATWYEFGQITIPSGSWIRGYKATFFHDAATSATRAIYVSLSETSAASSEDSRLDTLYAAVAVDAYSFQAASADYSTTTATTNYLNSRTGGSTATTLSTPSTSSNNNTTIFARCAYI